MLHSPALTWLEFARQCVSGLGVLHLPQAPDLKMPSTRPHCCANPRYCAYPCSVPLHSTLPAPSQIHPPPLLRASPHLACFQPHPTQPAPCVSPCSLCLALPLLLLSHQACSLCLTPLPVPGLAPAAALPPSLPLVSPCHAAACFTLPCCCPAGAHPLGRSL